MTTTTAALRGDIIHTDNGHTVTRQDLHNDIDAERMADRLASTCDSDSITEWATDAARICADYGFDIDDVLLTAELKTIASATLMDILAARHRFITATRRTINQRTEVSL